MFKEKTGLDVLNAVAEKLTANGMSAIVVSSANEAKTKVLDMISKDESVMTMTSITLNTVGLGQALEEGGYKLARTELMSPDVTPKHKKEIGAAPDVSVASVHAITKNGEIMIASATGSQLPAAAYGADKVIFVVGGQKIVENMEEGMKRIYEYVLPLESVRANEAYGITTGSSVNKMLVINKEIQPGRINIILVDEALGF
jgi:L-lactate utilization protein LutC